MEHNLSIYYGCYLQKVPILSEARELAILAWPQGTCSAWWKQALLNNSEIVKIFTCTSRQPSHNINCLKMLQGHAINVLSIWFREQISMQHDKPLWKLWSSSIISESIVANWEVEMELLIIPRHISERTGGVGCSLPKAPISWMLSPSPYAHMKLLSYAVCV